MFAVTIFAIVSIAQCNVPLGNECNVDGDTEDKLTLTIFVGDLPEYTEVIEIELDESYIQLTHSTDNNRSTLILNKLPLINGLPQGIEKNIAEELEAKAIENNIAEELKRTAARNKREAEQQQRENDRRKRENERRERDRQKEIQRIQRENQRQERDRQKEIQRIQRESERLERNRRKETQRRERETAQQNPIWDNRSLFSNVVSGYIVNHNADGSITYFGQGVHGRPGVGGLNGDAELERSNTLIDNCYLNPDAKNKVKKAQQNYKKALEEFQKAKKPLEEAEQLYDEAQECYKVDEQEYEDYKNYYEELCKTITDRDELFAERDLLFAERDKLFAKRDILFAERDAFFAERDKYFAERDKIFGPLRQLAAANDDAEAAISTATVAEEDDGAEVDAPNGLEDRTELDRSEILISSNIKHDALRKIIHAAHHYIQTRKQANNALEQLVAANDAAETQYDDKKEEQSAGHSELKRCRKFIKNNINTDILEKAKKDFKKARKHLVKVREEASAQPIDANKQKAIDDERDKMFLSLEHLAAANDAAEIVAKTQQNVGDNQKQNTEVNEEDGKNGKSEINAQILSESENEEFQRALAMSLQKNIEDTNLPTEMDVDIDPAAVAPADVVLDDVVHAAAVQNNPTGGADDNANTGIDPADDNANTGIQRAGIGLWNTTIITFVAAAVVAFLAGFI